MALSDLGVDDLKLAMEDALARMQSYATAWLEAWIRRDEADSQRFDNLHTAALRDFRRAERKLRKLEKRSRGVPGEGMGTKGTWTP